MFFLDFIARIFRLLNSAASPAQLAGGFTLGFMLGLTPGWPLHTLVLLLIIILFNVNLSMSILGAATAVGLAWLLDPWIEQLGYYLLVDVPTLQVYWTTMYNDTVALLTRFNNTVVMGSLALSLILALPMFLLTVWLIKRYRDTLLTRIQTWRIAKYIRSTRVFQIYEKLRMTGAI